MKNQFKIAAFILAICLLTAACSSTATCPAYADKSSETENVEKPKS